jgi:Domain of unknown function (DUF4157)
MRSFQKKQEDFENDSQISGFSKNKESLATSKDSDDLVFENSESDVFLRSTLEEVFSTESSSNSIDGVKVSNPSDPEEREADSVSEAIVNETRDVDELYLGRKSNQSGGTVVNNVGTSSSLVGSDNGSKSGGMPLSNSVRGFFEPRFGRDFSGVRIHNDARANESARSVEAKAYAIGNQIVFGKGQYSPDSLEGKKLLAHELAHVMQQSDFVRRKKRSAESFGVQIGDWFNSPAGRNAKEKTLTLLSASEDLSDFEFNYRIKVRNSQGNWENYRVDSAIHNETNIWEDSLKQNRENLGFSIFVNGNWGWAKPNTINKILYALLIDNTAIVENSYSKAEFRKHCSLFLNNNYKGGECLATLINAARNISGMSKGDEAVSFKSLLQQVKKYNELYGDSIANELMVNLELYAKEDGVVKEGTRVSTVGLLLEEKGYSTRVFSGIIKDVAALKNILDNETKNMKPGNYGAFLFGLPDHSITVMYSYFSNEVLIGDQGTLMKFEDVAQTYGKNKALRRILSRKKGGRITIFRLNKKTKQNIGE